MSIGRLKDKWRKTRTVEQTDRENRKKMRREENAHQTSDKLEDQKKRENRGRNYKKLINR